MAHKHRHEEAIRHRLDHDHTQPPGLEAHQFITSRCGKGNGAIPRESLTWPPPQRQVNTNRYEGVRDSTCRSTRNERVESGPPGSRRPACPGDPPTKPLAITIQTSEITDPHGWGKTTSILGPAVVQNTL